ncbi:fibrinogen related protein 12.1 [Elysia marginata]|uniref:Fibrinogen related protein 12.1 n=1 Tax=Elysia marginata TaxID=1093978 RepID=A0AAV4JMM5_9GAST|nr:fibrinogen related protein 12.1 [Elysia marginata]
MTRVAFSALWLSLLIGPAVSSSDLAFTLSPANPNLPGTSDSCGVLLCETPSLGEQRNITSMSVYKAVSQSLTGSDSTKPGNLSSLAFVSPSQPSVEQNSNGVKVSGSLKNGQASLRVELSKQTDCLTEYTCEVQAVDSEGKELITSYRLLQTQVYNNGKRLNKYLTSFLLTRFVSLFQRLDVKLATHELYLKEKLNSVEGRTVYLQKEVTDIIHQKLQAMENSSAKMEAQVETQVNSVETRLNSVEDAFENQTASMQNELTEKIDLIQEPSENNVTITYETIDEKFSQLNTRLDFFDAGLILHKVLETIDDRVDMHFETAFNASGKVGGTINKTADLLTSMISYNSNFKDDLMNRYKDMFDNVSIGFVDLALFQGENLTATVENSLRDFNDRLLIGSDRIKSKMNHSLAKYTNYFRTLKTGLVSAFDVEISKPALVESVTPELCKKNTPVLQQEPSAPYPLIYASDIVGLNTPILCDTQTDGGGWIVIQRRSTGLTDFQQNWETYKKGFGARHSDFWLGLENIHAITSSGRYELRVDLEYKGKSKYAIYRKFAVGSETYRYNLTVGSYWGTAGDSLRYHNGQRFTTFDRDNDKYSEGNCAVDYLGAWWYENCHHANLNGKWQADISKGPRWKRFTRSKPATFTEMKIRRLG